MIKNIITLLQVDDFIGKSKNIDIANGLNELTLSPKKIYKQKLREWKRSRK